MITLKDYQTRVLDSLCEFFRQAAKDGRLEKAFNAVRRRNNFPSIAYLPASSGGLPRAPTKQHPELNCSYAFSVSDSMPEVLNELREALASNGFTAAEAARIVLPVQSTMPLGSQPQTVRFELGKKIDAEVAQAQETALAGKVKIDVAKGEITVFVPLDKAETEGLKHCVKTPEAKWQVEEAVTRVSIRFPERWHWSQ